MADVALEVKHMSGVTCRLCSYGEGTVCDVMARAAEMTAFRSADCGQDPIEKPGRHARGVQSSRS